jgi:CelD/BcsL family acetyltransferase involved in cellulose biosynthesis
MRLRGKRRLRLLTLREGGRLVGLAPLSVSRAALPWMSRLDFLGTGSAGPDYLDVMLRRDLGIDAVHALAESLRSEKRAVRLDHVSAGLSQSARLATELAADGWTPIVSPAGICPFARLAGHSWQSYLGTLEPSHRRRVRRDLNTLGKKFDLRLEPVTCEAERREALAALIRFHTARWGRGSTAFHGADLCAFHGDVTRRALASGWLRMHVLRLNGAAAAATYCFSYDRRFYLYQHGFNEQFQKYSVGFVVLALTIRAAIEEGAVEFDMLYGDEPYKWRWATDVRHLNRIDLYPPRLAGRLHLRTVEVGRTARTVARRIFPRKSWHSNITPAGAGG